MDAFGTAVSISLQYGVPLEALVNKFSHMRFEPMGYTSNPDIKIAKSVVDYIFRWMGIRYLPGYREANTMTVPKMADEDAAGVQRSPVAAAAPASTPAAAPSATKPASNGHAGNGATALRIDGNGASVRDEQFARFQLDAPSCDNCGSITVRNGNCYLCHNCGNSMGCS
jgi:ribonucleoside-diphosphate reductase alpha chain